MVAVLSLIIAGLQGWVFVALTLIESVFFFLSGVGIRMRSRFAAIAAFTIYAAESFLLPFSVLRLFLCALLLANVRGTWLSSQWRSKQAEPPPVPLNNTLGDKLVDQLPIRIWPIGKFFYYFVAIGEAALVVTALIAVKRGL